MEDNLREVNLFDFAANFDLNISKLKDCAEDIII